MTEYNLGHVVCEKGPKGDIGPQGHGKMLEKEKNQHKGEIEESIDYKNLT